MTRLSTFFEEGFHATSFASSKTAMCGTLVKLLKSLIPAACGYAIHCPPGSRHTQTSLTDRLLVQGCSCQRGCAADQDGEHIIASYMHDIKRRQNVSRCRTVLWPDASFLRQ